MHNRAYFWKPFGSERVNFGDIYFSVSISYSFDSELFFGEFFKTLLILSAILFPIKSSVAYAVSIEYLADCLAWSRTFWLYLPLKF